LDALNGKPAPAMQNENRAGFMCKNAASAAKVLEFCPKNRFVFQLQFIFKDKYGFMWIAVLLIIH